MSFFISDAAAAQAAPAASQPGIEGLLFPLAILVFFYFLFIRPQNKRTKEQKQMLAALTKGAEVVTTGGVLGKVAEVDEKDETCRRARTGHVRNHKDDRRKSQSCGSDCHFDGKDCEGINCGSIAFKLYKEPDPEAIAMPRWNKIKEIASFKVAENE